MLSTGHTPPPVSHCWGTQRSMAEPAAKRARSQPQVSVADLVQRLQASKAQVKHVQWMPARPSAHAPVDCGLPPAIKAVLARARALPLWTHQAEAILAALKGEDVCVSTPTASGKSLWCVCSCARAPAVARAFPLAATSACSRSRPSSPPAHSYLAPLLHMLTEPCKSGQHGRALVLMPLKALGPFAVLRTPHC